MYFSRVGLLIMMILSASYSKKESISRKLWVRISIYSLVSIAPTLVKHYVSCVSATAKREFNLYKSKKSNKKLAYMCLKAKNNLSKRVKPIETHQWLISHVALTTRIVVVVAYQETGSSGFIDMRRRCFCSTQPSQFFSRTWEKMS